MDATLERTAMTPSEQQRRLCRLRASYPFVYCRTLTATAGGRPLPALQIGQGDTKILLTAGHHANEYITSMLCWELVEAYLAAVVQGGSFGGRDAGALYHNAMLYVVPMVNPDGIALVTGELLPDSAEYRAAQEIAAAYPDIPFPEGWKANLQGVDLNLNYPAGWEKARTIKAALGFSGPAPRDYPGARPLDQPETAALAAYAACIRPDLMLALHTQGRVIYPGPVETAPEGSEALAKALAAASGYEIEDVPAESANAGFKDWFLQRFHRSAFTVECGLGENPLPPSALDGLCAELFPLLVTAIQW